jgi:regulation of enolase protein 1 (concanavalin A-like superfamily)
MPTFALSVNRRCEVNKKYLGAALGQISALLFGLGLLETPVFAQICARPVPAPWQSTDVGDVGVPGTACQGPDADLFVWGAGADIWGTEDSFHFVYQPILDGRIAAHVSSQLGGDPFAKGGVMIRQTLDPASPHVILDMKPDGTIEFMTRSAAGHETTFLAGTDRAGGRYLELERRGDVVTVELCVGIDRECQTIGSTPWLSGPALIGFAVTSHDPTTLYRSSVPASMPTVSTVPQPWQSGDFGTVGQRGDAFFENDTFFVTGAGSDIWGSTDSFHYVWQFTAADTDIVARVVSEDATDPYAKAGIIMRQSYQLGAPTVILDVRPTGDVEFMARTREGEAMSFIAGGFKPAPIWLRLVRNAETFKALISDDGKEWQPVGTVDVPGQRFDYVGLAVTSHDRDALNTSVFDNVSVTR